MCPHWPLRFPPRSKVPNVRIAPTPPPTPPARDEAAASVASECVYKDIRGMGGKCMDWSLANPDKDEYPKGNCAKLQAGCVDTSKVFSD